MKRNIRSQTMTRDLSSRGAFPGVLVTSKVPKRPAGGWSAIVKNGLFGNLIQSSRRAEGKKIFDPKQLVDRVRVEDEDVWDNGHKALQRTTPGHATPLTAPKVDLFIALPIFQRLTNPRGFYRDDYIQNFTEDRLTVLEEKKHCNLISNPLKPLDSNKKISEKHLVCFPSAVVEIKHHKVSLTERNKCYWQVANAASTALSMLSRLSHFSIPDSYFGEIQPVVAFTFIGYESRVWIAFISEKKWKDRRVKCQYVSLHSKRLAVRLPKHYLKSNQNLKCIWEGDLRKVWDTVQLCRIIENVHYWTVRHFRPWVSSCLDKWRLVVTAKDENNEQLISELGDLKSVGSSDEYLTSTDEDYEVEPEEESESEDDEDESESEDEEEEGSIDDGKKPNYDSTSEDDLMSTDKYNEVESEEESVRTPSPTIRVHRAGKTRNNDINPKQWVGNDSSERFLPRLHNAASLSPEVLHSTLAPLYHGKTSPIPLRTKSSKNHLRSRSTG